MQSIGMTHKQLRRMIIWVGVYYAIRAGILSLSRQAVLKWEQGTGYPKMEPMILLAQELNTSLDDLVSGESTPVELPRKENSPTGKIAKKLKMEK